MDVAGFFPALMLVMNHWATFWEHLVSISGAATAGGTSILELRERERIAEDLLEITLRLRESNPDTLLVVNAEYADMVYVTTVNQHMFRPFRGPDGVHLPDGAEQSLRVARQDVGEQRLLFKSVHSLDAALHAERDGADMLVLGTVFPSASHPGGPTIGLEGVREVGAAVRIPVIGIGGITARNAGDVIRAGASGVAVISAIFDAPDPRAAAAELRAEIDKAWSERH
jgi:thiamine-phosphate pyrophosphorylase